LPDIIPLARRALLMDSGAQIAFVGLIAIVFGPGCISNANTKQHKNAEKVEKESEEPKDEGLTHVGGWLDVSAGGKRYYGLYQEIRDNGRVVEASGVVLMPWDDRPEVSVGPY